MTPTNPISQQFNQLVAQSCAHLEKKDRRAAIEVFLDWKIPEDQKQVFWENVKSRVVTHLAIHSTLPFNGEKARELIKTSLEWYKQRGELKSKISKEKTDHQLKLVDKRNTIAELEKQLLKK